jgi:peptide deformylase
VTYEIRTFGDPVLKAVAEPVTNIDEKLVRLTEEMFEVMYKAPGIGLAATQIGVQRQVFVYDIEDEKKIILNPTIAESSGEWVYDEGCLSIPGIYVEMLRPKKVLVRGINIEGNQVEFEADELLARLFQHEVDHLNGVLMFERMTADQRKEAVKLYRAREGMPKDAEPGHVKLV